MSQRQNPFGWSFTAGTWSGVRVRISWLYPVVAIWLWFKFGWPMGSSLLGILFVSVLLHEIGHVLMARSTGGHGDEILIWPLGGLAFVGVGSTAMSQFLTSAAGPAVNAAICLLTLPAVLFSPYALTAFDPQFVPIPRESFGQDWVSDLQVCVFSLNWMLLLLNLIPALPLDGGSMLRAVLHARLGSAVGTDWSIRIASGVSVLLALVAMLFLENTILVGLAFFLLVYAMQEIHQMQVGESLDDSFLGYDFSQGYTSLERSTPPQSPAKLSPFQRWLEKRRERRVRRQEEAAAAEQREVDELLAKVHAQGMNALSESEKRRLKKASERLRSRKGPQ